MYIPLKLSKFKFILSGCFLSCLLAKGQDINHDTLTASEIINLEIGSMRSAPHQLFIADSCLARRDTVCVCKSLLKIDIFYLIFRDSLNPSGVDTFLAKYNLNADAKGAFKRKFYAIWNVNRSASYKMFRRMHYEDQSIRARSENCHDSVSCARLRWELRKNDSVHFRNLYRYVMQIGWPAPVNGSYYAGALAVHDHQHHAL